MTYWHYTYITIEYSIAIFNLVGASCLLVLNFLIFPAYTKFIRY